MIQQILISRGKKAFASSKPDLYNDNRYMMKENKLVKCYIEELYLWHFLWFSLNLMKFNTGDLQLSKLS